MAYLFMVVVIVFFSIDLYESMHYGRLGSGLSPIGLIFLPIISGVLMVVGYLIGWGGETLAKKAWIRREVQVKDVRKHDPVILFLARHKAPCTIFIFLFMVIALRPLINTQALIGLEHLAYYLNDGSYIEHARTLIDNRVEIDVEDKEGNTPLFKAAIRGDKSSVGLLLANGADPQQSNNMGATPLHKAGWAGSPAVVTVLLEHGANVNAQDKYGDTALHEAVGKGRIATIKVLLAHGADPNIKDRMGQTPFWDAVYWGYKEVVKLLIEHGADVNVRDNCGRTPLGIADEEGYRSIERFLLKHGAKQ